jgi:hypothetical protein
MGCDLMQGFLLSRPLTPEAAGELLKNQKPPAPLLEVAAKKASPAASTECFIG